MSANRRLKRQAQIVEAKRIRKVHRQAWVEANGNATGFQNGYRERINYGIKVDAFAGFAPPSGVPDTVSGFDGSGLIPTNVIRFDGPDDSRPDSTLTPG